MTPGSLGAKIRALRHARGKTLRELAAQVGVSYQFLHMLETGVKHSTVKLPELAAALDVDVSHFEDEE